MTSGREKNSMLKKLLDMGEREILLNIGSEKPARTTEPIMESPAFSGRAYLLEELKYSIDGCTKCKLAPLRKNIVFGVGDPDARIVFVGEAPGADEDAQGEPFVGLAGKLLDKIFSAMGLSREKGVYICNVLKCRPPGNRDPEPDEVEQCIGILKKQIGIISPKVVCCLGRISAQNLLGTDATLSKLRERLHNYEGIQLLVTYHPAYLLRNPASKKPLWEDMKTLLKLADLPVPK